ncbi:MAG: DUF4252 domain-containing protein [Cyclobacteriaceae bacterium]|jgi:hypothetical protein|nr:DUF4252 domain-containing protein [Cyclobacteriaceae bacterium]
MKIILTLFCFGLTNLVFAQTKTTQALDDKYEGLSLYFYKNTLRMLNQTDDPAFDELIKDIEKMKFMMIDKSGLNFGKQDYAKLLAGYKSENYEEMMTGRYDGRNFDIYLCEQNGDVKGTVILANDSSSLFVLDIKGKIALDKAPELFKTIDSSTDIGKKIKEFTGRQEGGEKKLKGKKDNDNQDN